MKKYACQIFEKCLPMLTAGQGSSTVAGNGYGDIISLFVAKVLFLLSSPTNVLVSKS